MHDPATLCLMRTYQDRFRPIELVIWAGNFRAMHGCEPMSLWMTVVEEITEQFVEEGVATLVDLTTAAVKYGLPRIKSDRDALAIRQLSAEERQAAARKADEARQFRERETGQTARKAKKRPEGGLFLGVA